MRAVNLLPHENRSGRALAGSRFDPLVAGGAVLTAVVAVAIGGGFVVEHSHASSAQQKLDAARAKLAQVTARQSAHHHPTATPIVPTPAVVAQIVPWQTAVETVLSSRVAYDVVLGQIGRLVPANVSLSSVSLGGGAAGAATPTAGSAGQLNIAGVAFTEAGVAQLLSRIALIPQVTSVSLSSSTVDPKTNIVTFLIAAQLKGASTAFTTTTTTSGTGA